MQLRSRSRFFSTGRIIAALTALSLGSASILEYRDWRRKQSRIIELLAASGIADSTPVIIADAARENDPVRATLVAARGLLAREADPATFSELDPEVRRNRAMQGIESLASSLLLAQDAVKKRPASWQGHMILGATSFLFTIRSVDASLAIQQASWEGPLLRAHRLAPSQPEPPRFLASAYLSEWSRLGDEDRHKALEILRIALKDTKTLNLLLPHWLRVAPSLETALSTVPRTAHAWQAIMRHMVSREDWERYCDVRTTREDILLGEMLDSEASAISKMRAGDLSSARNELLGLLAQAPVRGPFHAVVTMVMSSLPAGPVSARGSSRLREWFEWERERCLQGACSLPPRVVSRLAGLAELKTSVELAEAAIMAGDLVQAEAYERRASRPSASEWAPYYLLKATRLAGTGATSEAAAALRLVHPDWLTTAEYRTAASTLERSASAETAPAARFPEWSSATWIVDGARRRMRIPERWAGRALEFEIKPTDSSGGAVEVVWNGEFIACTPASGPSIVRLADLEWLELNWLSVESLEQNRVLPGIARLSLSD